MDVLIDAGELLMLVTAAQYWVREHPANPNCEQVTAAVVIGEDLIVGVKGVRGVPR